jgi:uroporphyrinogen-III synthase
MRLLVTRPEPDNERTAAALRARGHEVLLAPLLRIEPVPDAELGPGPFAAILLTSANGARASAGHRRRGELMALPVLAIGRATADAARSAGFDDVTSADGDAHDLLRLAAGRFAGSKLPLLYLAGEDRSRELAGMLPAVAVRTVVIYRAAKAGGFPPSVREAFEQGRIDAVLHFSRRSVEGYVEAAAGGLAAAALKPMHYCLSERTAAPLRDAGAQRLLVAARPDEASLLGLIAGMV